MNGMGEAMKTGFERCWQESQAMVWGHRCRGTNRSLAIGLVDAKASGVDQSGLVDSGWDDNREWKRRTISRSSKSTKEYSRDLNQRRSCACASYC